MTTINRRQLLKGMGASAALVAAPWILHASPAYRVVVVGGGFAGATAAKYLRHWSQGAIDVTLVDANPNHVSCVMSNLILNERLAMSDITLDYRALQTNYGVNLVTDRVTAVDTARNEVSLEGTTARLGYDRLVLAPGIEFDRVPGVNPDEPPGSPTSVPHAWIAGGDTINLRDQLQSMPAGGTYVLTIPKAPYRCPPGPYERACLVADLIRREKGHGKVMVLDANPQITAERHTFERAFEELYPDILEYIPNAELQQVTFSGATSGVKRIAHANIAGIITEQFAGDVLNVIPSHRAGRVVVDAGLATSPDGRWAGVNPLSYQSTEHDAIHVIGDSQFTRQPKSAHMANAQAKICADAIIREFNGESVITNTDRADNVTTNSACFSPITYDTASWLTAVYRYNNSSGEMELVAEALGEAPDHSRENFRDMFVWAENLFADTFA